MNFKQSVNEYKLSRISSFGIDASGNIISGGAIAASDGVDGIPGNADDVVAVPAYAGNIQITDPRFVQGAPVDPTSTSLVGKFGITGLVDEATTVGIDESAGTFTITQVTGKLVQPGPDGVIGSNHGGTGTVAQGADDVLVDFGGSPQTPLTGDEKNAIYTLTIRLGTTTRTIDVPVAFAKSANEIFLATVGVSVANDYTSGRGNYLPKDIDEAKFTPTLNGVNLVDDKTTPADESQGVTIKGVRFLGSFNPQNLRPQVVVTIAKGQATREITTTLNFEFDYIKNVLNNLAKEGDIVPSDADFIPTDIVLATPGTTEVTLGADADAATPAHTASDAAKALAALLDGSDTSYNAGPDGK